MRLQFKYYGWPLAFKWDSIENDFTFKRLNMIPTEVDTEVRSYSLKIIYEN